MNPMDNLRDIRKRKGMSIGQLSSKTGISSRLLEQYENGKQTIPEAHLTKLARALFVEPGTIRPLTVWQKKREAPPSPEAIAPVGPAPEKPVEKREETPAPKPARVEAPAHENQLRHLERVAMVLGMDREALEREIGTPLEQLTRREASRWLGEFQGRIAQSRGARLPAETRHRAYLPEAIDAYELEYLTQQQQAGVPLTFTLFDGRILTGAVTGFSPYVITIREVDSGDELSLQKLAIAYYRRAKL